jgi:lipopolysaccharide transport system permease protein
MFKLGLPMSIRHNPYLDIYLSDLIKCMREWRIWTVLGWNDIKKRYRRSRIGQFWITLNMLVVVFGLGIVWSGIFRQDVKSYMPYLATSFVLWGFISSFITDGANAFIESESLMRQLNLSNISYLMRPIIRNILILIHNILIIPIVYFIFDYHTNLYVFFLPMGFLLVMLNCFWIIGSLGIISARYRDVNQLISSSMMLIFAVTPILFKVESMPEQSRFLMDFNPLASYLSLLRDPLLGVSPRSWDIFYAALWAVIGNIFFFLIYSLKRNRIVFWL